MSYITALSQAAAAHNSLVDNADVKLPTDKFEEKKATQDDGLEITPREDCKTNRSYSPVSGMCMRKKLITRTLTRTRE